MKEVSVYQIRETALGTGRAVFSVQQLSNLIGKSRAVSTVYLSRLVKKGLASRLMKGKISFVEDDFVIATQLLEPSYVSLDSALLMHGIIKQVPNMVECVTTKNSVRYKELGIVYHKLPGSMFSGYRRESKGSSYFFLAEPEKAFIDGIYLNFYSMDDIVEHLDRLDLEEMRKMACALRVRGAIKINAVIGSLIKGNY